MKNHGCHLPWIILIILLLLATICQASPASLKEHTTRIQVLHGVLEGGRGMIYTLNELKKGDILQAYISNTAGNLDPMLAIVKDVNRGVVIPQKLLDDLNNTGQQLGQAFSLIAAEKFLVWDDDSGKGYDASLTFQVPADGTYALFAGSMITNQSITTYKLGFTSGSYRLLVGINATEVAEGRGEPTGEPFVTINENSTKRPAHIQQLEEELSKEKLVTFHHIKQLQPGDSFYARLVSTNQSPLPRLFLSDFGGKPMAFGSEGEQEDAVSLTYLSKEADLSLRFYVDGSKMDSLFETATYRLDVGINAPEVLNDGVTANGLTVFEESKNVKIKLSIDQVVNVDQQSENFTVVGALQLSWQDPALAFSPDKCNCPIKKMGLNDLKAMAQKKDILLPTFIFFNQQGNRWTQGQFVLIEPTGLTTYRERFTVTLQAPDFDFRAYPFDHQQFNVRVDLAVPTEVFVLEAVEQEGNALGDQLGEEEWSVTSYSQEIESVPLGKNLFKSRLTMAMEVNRHLNFYLFRIILPLLLIITVSWVIFFLKDYGRQLEVASGNLLVFVAFNFTISDDLPRLGYLTLLDRMIITSFCCAAIVVLISVCQKRLEAKGKNKLASRIDNIVLITYPLVYVLILTLEYAIVVSQAGT